MHSAIVRFLNAKRYDVFITNNKRILRGETKNYVKSDKTIIPQLKLKQVEFPATLDLEDPFNILSLNGKTEVQQELISKIKWFKAFGSLAVSCSCGGGKTLGAVYLISQFKVKTLIVSARSSINSQWRDLLIKLYPHLYIKTIDGVFNSGKKLKKYNGSIDIYIYSPQYLMRSISNFPISCDFIIYDEIHSLLSEEFSKALMYNFELITSEKRERLPYMLCLSATYPKTDTQEYSIIKSIFGTPIVVKSKIVNTPVYVWDTRKNYTRKDKKGNAISNEKSLGKFDKKYITMNDYDCIDYFVNTLCEILNIPLSCIDKDSINDNFNKTKLIEEIKTLLPFISTKYKGFVITSTIDSSVYAWLLFHKLFKCGCLLIRDVTENSLFLSETDAPYESIDRFIEYKTLDFGTKITNDNSILPSTAIIFGTYHRLKEGISIENATWGLCTKFIYSPIARVQILGRCRRTSDDLDIQTRKRLFITNTIQIQTDEMKQVMLMRNNRNKYKGKIVVNVLYDFDYEELTFTNENYLYL